MNQCSILWFHYSFWEKEELVGREAKVSLILLEKYNIKGPYSHVALRSGDHFILEAKGIIISVDFWRNSVLILQEDGTTKKCNFEVESYNRIGNRFPFKIIELC